jgi:hypothetical protein
MANDSVLYTVGTALSRAQSNGTSVQLLVEGQWLSGRVAAVDGHGVVLVSDEDEHCVIRIGSVTVVRMVAEASQHAPLPSAAGPTARPMPAA